MNATTSAASSPSAASLGPVPQPRRSAGFTERLALQALGRLHTGTLSLATPSGDTLRFGPGGAGAPEAQCQLRDWAAVTRTLRAGDIGFAEAYIDGQWSSPDIAALLRLLLANRDAIERLVYGSRIGTLLHRLRHLLNRNTRRGSRKNIHAHYDLGNDFYRLWLDPSMNYSAAWFEGRPDQPLAQAQQAKMRRALDQAGVQAGGGQRVLEIGCGWGALAECATRERSAHLTGITLSDEQLAWARQRIERAGLAERCDLRLQDWRDLAREAAGAPYDAVVSIEMFEAVGREYWGEFFAALRAALKPGGRACIQSITIRDDLFERYARSSDFIQQYIFPGGLLPSVALFDAEARRAGLRVVDRFAFGPDYAETLRRWRRDFLAELPQVRALGFDLRFLRTWEFYLAYCEAAFDSGNTDVVQFTLVRD